MAMEQEVTGWISATGTVGAVWGGEAPAQDGPAQTQGEPDPDQPVTTGRLDSGT
jgi:hypothetical protein